MRKKEELDGSDLAQKTNGTVTTVTQRKKKKERGERDNFLACISWLCSMLEIALVHCIFPPIFPLTQQICQLSTA